MTEKGLTRYRFSFGPWNIHTGQDQFGPSVRSEFTFTQKIKFYKKLGFEGVQFHDDDVVNANANYIEMVRTTKKVRRILDGEGLETEFVAPRLWEDNRTIDGAFTSNIKSDRMYAEERSKRAIDIAKILGTKRLVIWPAREGTYIRESKDAKVAIERIVNSLNVLLKYDKDILILGEMKPNEPMDSTFCPTAGHFIGISYKTKDPNRVGVLIESAHAILAGLDPSEEMAYAMYHNKLWGVHLNDQNGLKFDEDKTFGSVDLRRAFNQVCVLERNGYGRNGEFVGLDVKAMRTQKEEVSTKHLKNSREVFLLLLEMVRTLNTQKIERYIKERDYEELEYYILRHIIGGRKK